jgi:hypothetical protein
MQALPPHTRGFLVIWEKTIFAALAIVTLILARSPSGGLLRLALGPGVPELLARVGLRDGLGELAGHDAGVKRGRLHAAPTGSVGRHPDVETRGPGVGADEVLDADAAR